MSWAHGARIRWVVSAAALLLLSSLAFVWYRQAMPSRLPYHDSFASGRMGEWQAFGGAWAVYNGAIRNNSDERGAKFITGSARWSDYTVDADVLLLGQDGDAGLIVRSTDEEEGVDSYSGYYVGLRDRNNTLTIGRADHGWIEYEALSPHRPLQSLYWYHLRIVAVGCDIAAVASDSLTGDRTYASVNEPHCARTGRVGLRSYSSGGVWKNIHVAKASASDLAPLRGLGPPTMTPSFLQSEAGFNSILMNQESTRASMADTLNRVGRSPLYTLGSLKTMSPAGVPSVTVRGSVTLTYPRVFLQDATGGVAVDFAQTPPLKIGDEMEATGAVEPHRFSAVIRAASGRLLWQRSPAPPLSVTASQAATGLYDAMFVETEGELESWNRNPDGTAVLLLRSGHQDFRAILGGRGENANTRQIALHSLVRVRGVCVVDQTYTSNLTPFAVLLRSGDDLLMVSGPPWWDLHNLIMIAISLPMVGLVAVFIYSRAEHWRLHAVLEERSRMAREIHDTLAQSFAGIAFQLESVVARSGPRDHTFASVAVALQMAERSRGEAHLSIAALRALHIDVPLGEILQKVIRQQIGGAGLALSVTSEGSDRRLPVEIEANVLRIVQESVANVVQHAQAARVDVHLAYAADRLQVIVQDDGRGFDPATVPGADQGHFGITGLYERATRIGASLALSSGKDGTHVSLEVPLPPLRNVAWRYLLSKIQRWLNMIPAIRR